MKRIKFLCAVIFPLIIFTGCATKEAVKSVSEEEVLRERVMAYWNYKIREEFEKSYEYEEPLYRKTRSLVKYVKGINTAMLKWKSVEIQNVSIEEAQADVDLKMRTAITIPGTRTSGEQDMTTKDRWVKVDDAWYHQPPKEGFGGK